MLQFFITPDERRQAQVCAAELDIEKSDPPGEKPYVWDVRIGCVNRWYDYASPEDKIGTVYFEEIREEGGQHLITVRCTTRMTHRPLNGEKRGATTQITAPKEHERLAEFFFRELLGRVPNVHVQRDNKEKR
jgi:hypothetical protein